MQNRIILFFLFPIVLGSCIPQKKLEYIQTKYDDNINYALRKVNEETIKPNDELYIRVSSFDDVGYNFFSSQSDMTQMNYGNETSVGLISYLVSDSGNIYFPILGNIYVKDLTINEATNKLRNQLSEYFNQPTVIMKFVNKSVTILGEVNQPGGVSYTKNKINIFEALGLAGDITIHGNRKNVEIIREINDTVTRYNIDLASDDVFYSELYFLRKDDIVYVKSRRSFNWTDSATPITLVLTGLTTILLFGRFIDENL